jgi:hypothetical protein
MGTATLVLAMIAGLPGGTDEVYAINQSSIRIPIHVEPKRRNEIHQLILFSSSDQGKTWTQAGVASPDQDGFAFVAPMDGVYWFAVCVEDKQGHRDPANIYDVQPSQKVLIDTLKPQIRLTAGKLGDEVTVNWEIQEDHLSPASLKLEYRSGEAEAWQPVNFSPLPVGQARFRAPGSGRITIRMMAQDTAGNQSLATAEATPGQTLASVPASPSYNTSLSPGPSLASGSSPAPGQPTSTPGTSNASLNNASWNAPSVTPTPPMMRPPEAPGQEPASPWNPPAASDNGRLVASSASPTTYEAAPTTSSVSRFPRGQLPPMQIVNSTQVQLDYQIEGMGSSGIGKADLWMTRDDGRTWQYFGPDQQLSNEGDTSAHAGITGRSMTVDLPGEGTYGFTIVVQSRAGLGRKPPMAGELPEIRVEVDTTPPEIYLFAPQADPKQHDVLVLTWSVTDKNLMASPITLQWSEQRDNNWRTIAENLPNQAPVGGDPKVTGRYVWRVPPGVPPRVFLRLLARDTAGNVSCAETPRPELIDLKEPEARLTGVRVAAR